MKFRVTIEEGDLVEVIERYIEDTFETGGPVKATLAVCPHPTNEGEFKVLAEATYEL